MDGFDFQFDGRQPQDIVCTMDTAGYLTDGGPTSATKRGGQY